MENRCDIKKSRNGDKRCFWYQGFLKARAAEKVAQNPIPELVAIPILQAPTISTYVQPATATEPTQPVTTMPKQPKQFPVI